MSHQIHGKKWKFQVSKTSNFLGHSAGFFLGILHSYRCETRAWGAELPNCSLPSCPDPVSVPRRVNSIVDVICRFLNNCRLSSIVLLRTSFDQNQNIYFCFSKMSWVFLWKIIEREHRWKQMTCRSYAQVNGQWTCAAGFAGKAEVLAMGWDGGESLRAGWFHVISAFFRMICRCELLHTLKFRK